MIKNSLKYFLLFFVVILLGSCVKLKKSKSVEPAKLTTESSEFPKAIGYVNDYEGILTGEQESALIAMIKDHEHKTTDQIVIVSIASLGKYENIKDYSFDLANAWGVGTKEKNNGVVIVFGKSLRKIYIQNGTGIVEKLTDIETKRIIDEAILSEFKKDQYFEGLKKGLSQLIAELEGDR